MKKFMGKFRMKIICEDRDIRYNILVHYWRRFLVVNNKKFPYELLKTITFELPDEMLEMLTASDFITCYFKEKEIIQNTSQKNRIILVVEDHKFVFLNSILIIPQGYIWVVGKVIKLEVVRSQYKITVKC